VKILLIRLRLIGDVVFTTPAVGAIRRRFPSAHICYLVEPHAAPIVRHNPHLDSVVIADRPRGLKRLSYDVALARRLRAERFDVVIDFHGGPRSAWLARASGAPQRIGYAVPWRKSMYTTRIPWTRTLTPPRHSVEAQWDLLAPLGIAPPDRRRDPITIVEDPAASAAVHARLDAAGLAPDAPLIVIHVSAGNPFRRWPAERFAHVAAALARQDSRRRIIITSGPADASAADRIAADAQQQAGLASASILRCGEFDLAELRTLIGRASLYLGGDSGPLHVASATNTPIVALFGPTLPERSMPWRADAVPALAIDAGPLPCRPCHQRHCVPGDFRCLTMITSEKVLAAADALLVPRISRTIAD
jgi:predicted lipopolysaccharide heptosyltransferase III